MIFWSETSLGALGVKSFAQVEERHEQRRVFRRGKVSARVGYNVSMHFIDVARGVQREGL